MKKTVIYIIIALIIVIGITAYLNSGSLGDKAASQEDAWVTIVDGNNETELNMTDIQQLGEENFEANLDTSDSEPEIQTYTGVPLVKVMEACQVELHGKSTVIVKAADGYTVALTAAVVMDAENVYLAYAQNGEPLGAKANGGKGPYQVIIRKDQFSQRWCKFVMEIEAQ